MVEESERLKKCQRLVARRKKGSNNRYKARKLLRREYKKLTSKKRDMANKIVHDLLEHERVYMQDENLRGWHKGLFGRTVQHSVLGLVKAQADEIRTCRSSVFVCSDNEILSELLEAEEGHNVSGPSI